MAERKFTPPTEFPAEYVDGRGNKAVILGRGPDKQFPFIGYDAYGGVISWTEHGEVYPKQTNPYDLHDIPKRITTWHNVYKTWLGLQCAAREYADACKDGENRLCVYRIERDEDGSNPEIFVEDV
ncbi:hypothetical protein [Lentibacter phage vB_LenP_ICBM3]|uniref:Uncharacterized protein n=1 Tax=Lentibacter phage vB_LenP_ICBM3 TaxID=2301530 RepID=A0A3G2YRA1_9CAUD|nr:hypothetical protein [Lentibacter phage vB_LenP_ICBM3]